MAMCIANCNQSSRSEKRVLCGGVCGKIFHLRCVGLAEFDLNYIDNHKNIFYLCMECVDFKKSITEKFKDILNGINESRDKLSNQESNLKDILIEINKVTANENKVVNEIKKLTGKNDVVNQTKTYASVCKNNPPVLVKPKTAQNCQQTKEDIEKRVDPTDIKYTNIKSKQNGVMIIESESSAETENIKKVFEEKLGEKYEIRIPEMRKPKLCIRGLRVKLSESEVLAKLRKQNDFLCDSDMICIKIMEKKYGRDVYYNIIIEIDSDGFKKAIEKEKLCIGWERCKVFDATYVKRCFNCLGFNHTSSNCRSKLVCQKCLGDHKKENCDQDYIEKCSNCLKANEKYNLKLNVSHNVFSKDCHVYMQKLRVEKSRIDY